MSRSYKKNPWVNDHKAKTTKRNKQLANKRVRRSHNIDDEVKVSRSSYKKISESWDISDYCWRWTKEQAKQEYEDGLLSTYIYKHYPTLKKWLNYWEKCCRRK